MEPSRYMEREKKPSKIITVGQKRINQMRGRHVALLEYNTI